MKRLRRLKRRGTTLVLVTTIGVIVAILGLSMIQLGYDARILAVRDVEKVSARCAADAGLEQAICRMQAALVRNWGQTWNDATCLPPSCTDPQTLLAGTNATFTYTIDEVVPHTLLRVSSTGTCGMATRTVHADFPDYDTVWGTYWDGIGLAGGLTAKNSVQFGVVGGVGEIKITSNSTAANALYFNTNVRVQGDVYCGPGGNPSTVIQTKDTITQTISGDIGASDERIVWPDVSAPTGMTPGDAVTGNSIGNNKTVTLNGGSYQYASNLKLGTSATLNINGHVVMYVPGQLTLGTGSQILLGQYAELELYIGVRLDAGNSGNIGVQTGVTGAPIVKIYGLPTCSGDKAIELKTKGTVETAVYAPEAAVLIHNGKTADEVTFTGAVVGRTMTIDNGADFMFDPRLSQLPLDQNKIPIGSLFKMSRWWED